jgi:CAAX prenyl protease-like protein
MLAVQRAVALPPLLMEGGSVAIVAAVIALSWRRTPDLQPGKIGVRYGLGSLIVGAAGFFLWIAPDVSIAGYRHHPWFENQLFGKFVPGLSKAARTQPAVLWLRALRAIALAPAAEELFWRAWFMRWLVRDKFLELPLGTYSPLSFWLVALLFGMEHGPQWDVGIVAGILYNGWMVRTKSLGDLILVHAMTNACLSAYVLTTGKWEYWP